MLIKTPIALALMICAIGVPAHSADFADPSWPCVQRKVNELSLGLMWPHPVDVDLLETNDTLRKDVAELADKLALRRVELEDLAPDVAEFANTYEGDAKALSLVFSRVFNSLSKRRTRIIGGIGKFSFSQIALAEQIDSARVQMDKAMAAEEPDFDLVDKLEEQIDWDQLIHSDRQRSISYLCETPLLLEKRLFAIARMLQQVVQDPG